ncbi:unnamed protein product [Amoebophrya sp. A120]|nr:unnamed protein product [Amoebophrya sp. A120]|eukprot:GSA120T00022861001.1
MPDTWNVAAALQAGPPETFQFREFCERTPGDAELYKWSTCFMEEFKVTNWRVTGVKSFMARSSGFALSDVTIKAKICDTRRARWRSGSLLQELLIRMTPFGVRNSTRTRLHLMYCKKRNALCRGPHDDYDARYNSESDCSVDVTLQIAKTHEQVISFESMFEGTAGMSFPLFWDVSKARDMKGMFSKSDLNQDLSTWGWDVSAVMNMDEMFENADAFTGQGLSTWTVSRVTSMSRMFQEAAMFNGDLYENEKLLLSVLLPDPSDICDAGFVVLYTNRNISHHFHLKFRQIVGLSTRDTCAYFLNMSGLCMQLRGPNSIRNHPHQKNALTTSVEGRLPSCEDEGVRTRSTKITSQNVNVCFGYGDGGFFRTRI